MDLELDLPFLLKFGHCKRSFWCQGWNLHWLVPHSWIPVVNPASRFSLVLLSLPVVIKSSAPWAYSKPTFPENFRF